MTFGKFSLQTLKRLPFYLHYLRTLPAGLEYVSAAQIADAMKLGEVQVRKDLASASNCGKPKMGYAAKQLAVDIENLLMSDDPLPFCIVGAGSLGVALAQYPGFSEFGLRLAAIFDTVPERIGKTLGAVRVEPMEKVELICKAADIRVGVIAASSEQAQSACNLLASAGIEAIWNFAPTYLTLPGDVYVENENMAAQLGILSRRLRQPSGCYAPGAGVKGGK